MGNVLIGTPISLDGLMNDRADVPREERKQYGETRVRNEPVPGRLRRPYAVWANKPHALPPQLSRLTKEIRMQKIVTFLWFNDQAKEAVDLYVSLFENAKIINTSYLTESVAKAAGKKPGDLSTI